MKNQQGLTLVELLAVLVLVSIVASAIWTALSIGTAHSELETNKTKLQQEANLVIAKLRNEHRQNDFYHLQFDTDDLEIKTDPTGTFIPVTSGGFSYSGKVGTDIFGIDCGTNIDTCFLDSAKIYDTETAHTDIVLTVSALDGAPSVTVETKLTRILSD